jgi:hypothetical protein
MIPPLPCDVVDAAERIPTKPLSRRRDDDEDAKSRGILVAAFACLRRPTPNAMIN